jgi:hypothetical protein
MPIGYRKFLTKRCFSPHGPETARGSAWRRRLLESQKLPGKNVPIPADSRRHSVKASDVDDLDAASDPRASLPMHH